MNKEIQQIIYLKGNALQPDPNIEGKKYIIHICNNIGKWGKGFVLNVSKKWKEPEIIYKNSNFKLGDIQIIECENNIFIINMIAQNGINSRYKIIDKVDYEALTTCFDKIRDYLDKENNIKTIHMPYIGCNLAGSNWNKIKKYINILKYDCYVYEYQN